MKTISQDDIEMVIEELASYQDSARMLAKNGEITHDTAAGQVDAFDASINLLRGLLDENTNQ